MKLIIVTPLYRPLLDRDEQQALIHLLHYLPNVPKALICPHRLEFNSKWFDREPFPDNYFANVTGYNRLMLSAEFYDRFAAYDYVLIVQLDALVLSSNIESFLQLNVDYMGAPWFKDQSQPEKGFLGAGNGGLSLRRVAACRQALNSAKLSVKRAIQLLGDWQDEWMLDLQRDLPPMRLLKKINFIRKTWTRGNHFIDQFEWNEDYFWALRVPFLVDNFRVASVEQSLRFAFEMFPTYCLHHNNQQLPFGCHAWAKYDRAFWEPHLLPIDAISVTLDKIVQFT
ncbi:MAG: DUF5672 family protein [Aggregatilineales bacterium]